MNKKKVGTPTQIIIYNTHTHRHRKVISGLSRFKTLCIVIIYKDYNINRFYFFLRCSLNNFFVLGQNSSIKC